MRALFALFVTASLASAESWGLREGDTPFTPADLTVRLSGQTLVFYDDGAAQYYEDGRYSYTYAGDGGAAYGYWRITSDGAVCIDFVNGFARCDLYVLNAGRLVLLDEKGDRYPVRP